MASTISGGSAEAAQFGGQCDFEFLPDVAETLLLPREF